MRVRLLLVALASAACAEGSKATAQDGAVEPPGACQNVGECHQALWPRVIVGLVPSTMRSERLEDVLSVRFRELPDGPMREGRKRPCPRLASSFVCSVGDYPGENVRRIEVLVGPPGEAPARFELDLVDFNHCARKIAYLPLLVTADNKLEPAAPQYLSPCDGSSGI